MWHVVVVVVVASSTAPSTTRPTTGEAAAAAPSYVRGGVACAAPGLAVSRLSSELKVLKVLYVVDYHL